MQRVTSTVERTVSGDVITGFEYIYDDLSRIVEEKVLANSSKICYAYDVLGRVTTKTVRDLNTNAVVSTENYCYDAAGNVVCAPDGCYTYDTNNRLTVFDGFAVSYDLDGNMLSNGKIYCTYDSANRLTYAGGINYTYNAEDVRIRAFSEEEDTTYTYNTNAKLSMLLMKTTNGVVTKYVYGKGLIGEESGDTFKTYHFDCRGSTVAITDANGNVTDTFAYDTYGKLLTRTGTSNVIFGYNGRDGVVTDSNGLVYMRARYYSPDMRRFVNADIVAGGISNAVTLNRFAYANGNPVSFVDPFGLSAERGQGPTALEAAYMAQHIYFDENQPDLIGGWIFDKFLDEGDGSRIGLYKRITDEGVVEFAIVNRGSATTSDWINNVLQPFGVSADMHKSISIAKDFVEKHPDANITFVGHSKGGGEALANAKATNRDAIVFNPSIPNYEFYGLGDEKYTAKATSYVVKGEILSSLYIAVEAIALNPITYYTWWLWDDAIAYVSRFVFYSKPFWETEWLENDEWSPVKDHGFCDIYKELG